MKQTGSIQRDIKKIQQSKQFLTILILLFVVMLFWVMLSLITSQQTERIDPELQKLALPLTPVIEMEVFDRIEAKREYSAEELAEFTIFKVLISRDGRTERIVPLEFTLEDLENSEQNTTNSNTGSSRLEQEIATPLPSPSPTLIPDENLQEISPEEGAFLLENATPTPLPDAPL